MENVESYLARKHQEARLINECLVRPITLRRSRSVAEAIRQKFQLAAALKAERVLEDWALTETGWASMECFHSGPFELSYGYQRADLRIRGPAIYEALRSPSDETVCQSIYTCSGMAAISAVLMALRRNSADAELLAPPGCYSETLELVEMYGRPLRLGGLGPRSEGAVHRHAVRRHAVRRHRVRILLIDSSVAKWMEPSALAAACENIELVLFDTTCFWRGSGRIRRVLDWALGAGLPIVLVRSHTKLDSLGVEYGRIGSIVFAASRRSVPPSRLLRLREIIDYAADAVRLFGGAAIPAHFPPFVGRDTYGSLTASRIAAMLRNSRRMGRSFAAAFPGPRQVTIFQHGHYVTLAPMKRLDEIATKKLAGALSAELQAAGLPIRHAGSFGFDFAAVEWFRDTLMNRNVIRVSAPDLPASLADKITSNIIRWWSRNAGEPLPCLTSTSPRRVRLPTHGYFGDLAIGRPCHRRKTGCSIQNPG